MSTVPTGMRSEAPDPVPNASGSMAPIMVAVVMSIGRIRVAPDSMIA